MQHFDYKPHGVCPMRISFDLEGDTVHNVSFTGGCNGNLQGMSRLVEGMNIDDVIARVQGIHCGMKPTSCPDQLAQALLIAKEKLAKEAQPEA